MTLCCKVVEANEKQNVLLEKEEKVNRASDLLNQTI